MSEISDLVAIYGEVDRRLAEEPGLRPSVALLIPQYETDVTWYEDFLEWTDELALDEQRRERELGQQADLQAVVAEAPPFPDLIDAVRGLAEPRRRAFARARRLHAITALVRAFPETREPDHVAGRELGRQAIQALVTADVAGPIRNEALLDFLAEPERDELFLQQIRTDADAYWNALVEVGAERGFLVARELIGARPCSTSLKEVEPGVFAAVIDAGFTTDQLSFDDACCFLNPENWAESAFWCEMHPRPDQLGPHVRRYDEVVSVDCPRKNRTWTVRATLDFTTTLEEDSAEAAYDLSPGIENPHVSTDEGFLAVDRIDGGIAVRATKRVRFTRAFSGEAITLVICALGYVDALIELVETSIGGAPPGAVPRRRGDAAPGVGGGGTTTTTGSESLLEELIDRTAGWAKSSINDCADAAAVSADTVDAGKYGANAVVKDITGSWVRAARESAGMLNALIETSAKTKEPTP